MQIYYLQLREELLTDEELVVSLRDFNSGEMAGLGLDFPSTHKTAPPAGAEEAEKGCSDGYADEASGSLTTGGLHHR